MKLNFKVAPIIPDELYHLTAIDEEKNVSAGDVIFGIPGKQSEQEILPAGEIFSFKIEEDYQGRNGAAKEVMKRVENELCTLGFQTALLHADKYNAHAADFYERAGWQKAAIPNNSTTIRFRKSLVKEFT